MKKTRIIIVTSFLFVILLVSIGLGLSFKRGESVKSRVLNTKPAQVQTNNFSYAGKTGVDALKLLKEKTTVEMDKSGMVATINGRRADVALHEYWAFYVNGKMASVGPADYKTKDTDKIEWKIEKF